MYQKVFGFDRYNIDVGGCEVDGFALQKQGLCNYACLRGFDVRIGRQVQRL